MSLLRLDDVKVWFGGVRAVDGISLTLEPGKVYGVVGPNGSGKTTLLNAISGVQPVTAGTVHLAGVDRTTAPEHVRARAGLARTFQLIKLLPTLSVRDNVLLGADWTRDGAGEAAADEALERLGIEHLAGAAPDVLPYGLRRRVEIARALASAPRLLLLDEPLAGMNRAERDEIATIMRALGDGGLTQLVIEHDLRTLQSVCDHLFVMNFGRLIAEGAPRETAALPHVREAYLGSVDAPA